jgi:hypothetical protein
LGFPLGLAYGRRELNAAKLGRVAVRVGDHLDGWEELQPASLTIDHTYEEGGTVNTRALRHLLHSLVAQGSHRVECRPLQG